MTLEWEQLVVVAQDPVALGQWWAAALGWSVVNADADEFEIRPSADRMPGMMFLPVQEPKIAHNRLHVDFRPADQQREVTRLISLGARPVDVGQAACSWVVLADPEGNEFCVLSSRTPAHEDE